MSLNINKEDSMILNECLEALAIVIEYNMKDFPVHQHAIRVGEGCVLIGQKMGLSPDVLQKMYYGKRIGSHLKY